MNGLESTILVIEHLLLRSLIPIIAGIIMLIKAKKETKTENILVWILTADALEIIAAIGRFLQKRQITVGNLISVLIFVGWNVFVIWKATSMCRANASKGVPTANNKNPPKPIAKEVPYVQNQSLFILCRVCGTKLLPDAVFCPECGVKVIRDVSPVSSTEKNNAEVLPLNGPLVAVEEQNLNEVPTKPPVVNLTDKGLSPILRRAFLLIEDGDWQKADDYLERVLDDDPENAYAYLGKLLIEKNVTEFENLSLSPEEIKTNGNYKKALRYAADNDLKMLLQWIVESPIA